MIDGKNMSEKTAKQINCIGTNPGQHKGKLNEKISNNYANAKLECNKVFSIITSIHKTYLFLGLILNLFPRISINPFKPKEACKNMLLLKST
jgi:hypothetical protein